MTQQNNIQDSKENKEVHVASLIEPTTKERKSMTLGEKLQSVYDTADNRKKEMQRKFIEQSKKVPNGGVSAKDKTNKPVKEKKHSDSDKQLKAVTKKLEESRKKETDLKVTLQKQKKVNATLREELSEVRNKVPSLESKSSRVEQENKILKEKLALLEKDNERLQFQRDSARTLAHQNDSKLTIYRNQINKSKKANIAYKARIHDLVTKSDRSLPDMRFRNHLAHYKTLLEQAQEKLVKERAEHNKKINKYVNNLRRLAKSKVREVEVLCTEPVLSRKEQTGVLRIVDNFQYFESTMGNFLSLHPLQDGTPCAVEVVDDNMAILSRVFPVGCKVKPVRATKLKSAKKQVSELKPKCKYDSPYKVLIIGEENKDRYVQALTGVGLDVSWFSSYENSESRLREIVDRFDIVLCLLSHSRHYATVLMETLRESNNDNSIKYNTLKDETVDTILGRINYVVENSQELKTKYLNIAN